MSCVSRTTLLIHRKFPFTARHNIKHLQRPLVQSALTGNQRGPGLTKDSQSEHEIAQLHNGAPIGLQQFGPRAPLNGEGPRAYHALRSPLIRHNFSVHTLDNREFLRPPFAESLVFWQLPAYYSPVNWEGASPSCSSREGAPLHRTPFLLEFTFSIASSGRPFHSFTDPTSQKTIQ